MRTTILTVLTAILVNGLHAQAPDITLDWGPIMKSKETDFNSIIGADDDFFYTYGTESKGMLGGFAKPTYHIKKYERKNYRVKYDVSFDQFEYKGKDASFRSARMIDDEVHMFFDVYHSKLDKKYVLTRKVDSRGKLLRTEELDDITAEKRREGGFSISYSPDSTKMLLYADPPYERKEAEKFNVKITDMEYKVLWEKDIILPYTDKYFNLLDRAVTNAGDVFILGYSEPDKTKGERKERGASNRAYKLFRISRNESDILEYSLDLDDKFVHSATIKSDFGEGKMAIAGFYSGERHGSLGGSFFITIDQQTLDPVSAQSQAFDKNFLTNFMSERKAEKGRELRAFTFRNIIRKKDGGAVIVAEQYYVTQVTTRSGNVSTTTYYYHYNDLIVLNINPDASIAWSAYVPKEQTTANDNGFYSSYLLLVEAERMHFIYNDDRKNLERIAEGKDVRTMTSPKKSIAVISTIEKDGSVVYDQLFRNKDFSAILVPRKSYQVNPEEVILFGIKGSKSRFGKMSFQ